MLRKIALAAVSAAGVAYSQITKEFVGQGHIMVLNTSDIMTSERGVTIGCLDATGALTTKSDCAVFTRNDEEPHIVWTSEGNCTFTNAAMPTNTDSYYGDRNHAWSCSDVNSIQDIDRLYTVVSLQLYEAAFGAAELTGNNVGWPRLPISLQP